MCPKYTMCTATMMMLLIRAIAHCVTSSMCNLFRLVAASKETSNVVRWKNRRQWCKNTHTSDAVHAAFGEECNVQNRRQSFRLFTYKIYLHKNIEVVPVIAITHCMLSQLLGLRRPFFIYFFLFSLLIEYVWHSTVLARFFFRCCSGYQREFPHKWME